MTSVAFGDSHGEISTVSCGRRLEIRPDHYLGIVIIDLAESDSTANRWIEYNLVVSRDAHISRMHENSPMYFKCFTCFVFYHV